MNNNSITSFSGEYRFLSNFYPSKIEVDEITYPTVEHAFQAHKTYSIAERKRIAMLMTPGKAKRAGRQLNIRADWGLARVPVMKMLLHKKFSQSPLKEQLISTGDRMLIEGNSWHDTFWGVCDGVGLNWLGILLIEIRSEIRQREGR